MNTALQVAGVVLSLLLLWLGLKKVELKSPAKVVLAVADAGLLVAGVVSLGWLGLIIVIVANVAGFLGWGVRLALERDHLQTAATIRSGESREAIRSLQDRLQPQKAFSTFDPIELATLIRTLADCGRSAEEIEVVAPAVAMLSVAHGQDAVQLAPDFDRVLRLYGEPTSNAMAVADTLTASTLASACSFSEMLAACITAASQ